MKIRMFNPMAALALLLSVASCSRGDAEMCACLKAGHQLNAHSSKIMMQENITRADADKMKKLKQEKVQKCRKFQTMSGEQMREKSEGCSLK